MVSYLVCFMLFLPFFSSILLFFKVFSLEFSKLFGFFVSVLIFLISLVFFFLFDHSTSDFQFLTVFCLLSNQNLSVTFGIDGISIFFLVLTTFLVPLCFLYSWDINEIQHLQAQHFFALFFLIESFLIVVFITLDLFVFYVFFEAVLLPMFMIVGVWGTRHRKTRASLLFFIFTLFGSLFMLLSILLVFFETGTTCYIYLLDYNFALSKQKFLWLGFFFSFAVKIPMVPVHLWLPEAHVEAPTCGSVILAGVLLKLGSYGLLRFSLGLFPLASFFFRPFVFLVAIVGVIYTTMTAMRQVDLKRVVAYASIAHMNMTVLGLFSFNIFGFEGAIFQMVSHGLVSGALFFCIGMLYDRYHTKLVYYFGGLSQTIPKFSLFFLVFSMANIGLPGTSSFVGEFLIFLGVFYSSRFVGFVCIFSMVLGAVYALWLFNRVVYGNLKSDFFLFFALDITRRESAVLFPFVFFVIVFGIFPFSLLNTIAPASKVFIQLYQI